MNLTRKLTPIVPVSRAVAPGQDQGVELVGGPRCGSSVPWPAGQPRAYVPYHDGLAAYQYEGGGLAKYLRG